MKNMQKWTPLFLKGIGVALLLVGILAAFYAPLELFVYYMFSEGGQFYYDGFGMGSLWFGTLTVLNLGYYVIAAICLPLGIGHIKLRRWSLTLTRLYLWFWLGAGILLFAHFVLLAPTIFKVGGSQAPVVSQLIIFGMAALTFLILLPLLGLWFYGTTTVRAVFTGHDPKLYWTERTPFPLLVLLLLDLAMIVVIHIAIFFQGIFPWFGQILLLRSSAYFMAFCVLALIFMIYGIIGLKKWAWWGSMLLFSLLTISGVLSFAGYHFYDLMLLLNPPVYELGLLDKMVFLYDLPVVGLFVFPLLCALGLSVYSRRYFYIK